MPRQRHQHQHLAEAPADAPIFRLRELLNNPKELTSAIIIALCVLQVDEDKPGSTLEEIMDYIWRTRIQTIDGADRSRSNIAENVPNIGPNEWSTLQTTMDSLVARRSLYRKSQGVYTLKAPPLPALSLPLQIAGTGNRQAARSYKIPTSAQLQQQQDGEEPSSLRRLSDFNKLLNNSEEMATGSLLPQISASGTRQAAESHEISTVPAQLPHEQEGKGPASLPLHPDLQNLLDNSEELATAIVNAISVLRAKEGSELEEIMTYIWWSRVERLDHSFGRRLTAEFESKLISVREWRKLEEEMESLVAQGRVCRQTGKKYTVPYETLSLPP